MSPKLKVDLHTHTAEDPLEDIKYNAFQLIDRASQEGFDVLSITNHDTTTFNQELAEYAEKKGVLLIAGMEANFSNKHILIINPGFKKNPLKRSLKELAKIKNDENLIIAPHPFFPSKKSLKKDLFPYLSYFDAIEFSHYYNHYMNWNKKAIQITNQHKIPLVATSDSHNLWQIGKTFTLVEAEKELLSVIKAIKNGKIEVRTTPLSPLAMARIFLNFFLSKRLKIQFRL